MKSDKYSRKINVLSKDKERNKCSAWLPEPLSAVSDGELYPSSKPSSSSTREWIPICEFFGRERNGCTHYYSRRVNKHQLGQVYDFESKNVELRFVPNPYCLHQEADMTLYVREYQREDSMLDSNRKSPYEEDE